jgi:hypothetical protein
MTHLCLAHHYTLWQPSSEHALASEALTRVVIRAFEKGSEDGIHRLFKP